LKASAFVGTGLRSFLRAGSGTSMSTAASPFGVGFGTLRCYSEAQMEVAMPRWLRVIRGMIGTGLTFAVGVGVVASITGALVWLGDGIKGRELIAIAGRLSVPAFLLGVAFSAVLAVTARGRQFSKLSLRLVGGLGAGAGIFYFVFLALNGGRNWSPRNAIANFVLLSFMGAGSAAAMLMIARRASPARQSGDELHSLGEGDVEIVRGRSRSKVEAPKL